MLLTAAVPLLPDRSFAEQPLGPSTVQTLSVESFSRRHRISGGAYVMVCNQAWCVRFTGQQKLEQIIIIEASSTRLQR